MIIFLSYWEQQQGRKQPFFSYKEKWFSSFLVSNVSSRKLISSAPRFINAFDCQETFSLLHIVNVLCDNLFFYEHYLCYFYLIAILYNERILERAGTL